MKTNLKDKLLAGFILASAIVIILLSTGGKFISFNSQPENFTPTPFFEPVLIIEQVPDVEPVPLIESSPVAPLFPVPPPPDTTLKVKDNIVYRTIYKNGEEIDLKLKIEQGEVTELYVDGKKIPEKDYNKYQTEIDETLDNLMELEEDLAEANEKLTQIEMEDLKKEIEENMKDLQERMQEIDVDAIVDNLKNIDVPEIDKEKIKQEIEHAVQEIQSIDMEKIRAEMEFAMQSACEAMKNIEFPDMDKLKSEMDKAMQELKEFDQEKIQHEIQEAISDIRIDKEEIRREIEKAFQEIKEIDMEEIKRFVLSCL